MIDVYLNDELIDTYDCQISAVLDRSVLRTAQFTTSIDNLSKMRVYNQTVMMIDRATGETLFTGYYDDVIANVNVSSGDVRVSCRDKSKKIKNAIFNEDVTFEGPGASADLEIQSVEASSFLQSGAEIQSYAEVYNQQATVVDVGVPVDVDFEGDIINGFVESPNKRIEFSGYLDLKSVESIQTIQLLFEGDFSQIEVSDDGNLWTEYTSGTVNARYIYVRVIGTEFVETDLKVLTNTDYDADNVLDENEESWRPALNDLQQDLIFHFDGVTELNSIQLLFGINDADRRTLVEYRLSYSAGNVWRDIGTFYANSDLKEHCIDPINTDQIKLRIINVYGGKCSLRSVKIMNGSHEYTIDAIVREIAETEGETNFDLERTCKTVDVTFELGQNKWDQLKEMVNENLGWELYYDESGVLKLEQPILRTDQHHQIDSMLPPFQITFSDADIKNEIIAIHDDPDATLTQIVRDDLAYSSTSIVNIGTRSLVVRSDTADSNEKLRSFAKKELALNTKVTVPAQLTVPANQLLKLNDIIHITENKSSTNDLFIINGYTLTANLESATYDLRLELEVL